jgi:hypothetical protein
MATQFSFGYPLYNEALVEATRVSSDTFIPVITTDIRIILKWIDKYDNKIGYIRLYPNPSGDILVEEGEEQSSVLYDDAIYRMFVTDDGKQTRNFLRQVNIERNVSEGGNTVKLIIYDPQGRLLDCSLMNVYMNALKNGDKASVMMSMVYGWQSSDPTYLDTYGAPLGDDLTLFDLTVDVEYFGATYTFTFVDSVSTKMNTTISCWQLAPPDSQNQSGTDSASGDITFPQALIEAWKMQHKAGNDIFGKSGKYYLITDNTNETFLPQSAYNGDTTVWKGKAKSFADWNPGTAPFKSWICDKVKTDYPTEEKVKYEFKEMTVGSRMTGSPTDYLVFDGESWVQMTTIADTDAFKIRIGEEDKKSFRVPKNSTFCAITVAPEETAISSDTIPGKQEVIKYFIYATPIRSPHATVIRFDLDSNNVFGLYVARGGPQNIPKQKIPETDLPKENSTTTGTQQIAGEGGAACKPLPKTDSPANPEDTTNEAQADSVKSVDSVAMLGIGGNLEVLGDPDLCTMIGTVIAIDFDEYSPALLPWIRGIYMINGISETLNEGMWTHQLKVLKIANLGPDDGCVGPELQTSSSGIKFNSTTGLVETPSSISVDIIPRKQALTFLKITNYLEWLLGALGIAAIFGNLIGGIISELSSIYSGVLGLFSNEELANISNTIQTNAGGKSYDNPQNLGANTSQNSIQQYYNSQTQTTKEILTNYCENFSKMDDIEDVQARKDVALLATKFGGDMVRSQVLEMASAGEEITLETVKEKIASNRKWYRTGDKNFAVNVKNFSIKKLNINSTADFEKQSKS